MGGWEYLKEVVNAEKDNSAVENGQSMGAHRWMGV